MLSDLEINQSEMSKKLNDSQFSVLVDQIDLIDEQIKTLQESKKDVFKLFNVTKQAFHSRKRRNLAKGKQ